MANRVGIVLDLANRHPNPPLFKGRERAANAATASTKSKHDLASGPEISVKPLETAHSVAQHAERQREIILAQDLPAVGPTGLYGRFRGHVPARVAYAHLRSCPTECASKILT